jgi:hypothetical protein
MALTDKEIHVLEIGTRNPKPSILLLGMLPVNQEVNQEVLKNPDMDEYTTIGCPYMSNAYI